MQLRDRVVFLAVACIGFGLAFPPRAAHASDAAGSVTVPMQLELDRPYIDVMLTGPDGQRATAHAYVDTGGGALILSAGLAKKLGLTPSGEALHGEGQTLVPTAPPAPGIGGKPIELVDARALIDARVANLLSGSPETPRTLLLQRGGKRLTVHAMVQPVFQPTSMRHWTSLRASLRAHTPQGEPQ